MTGATTVPNGPKAGAPARAAGREAAAGQLSSDSTRVAEASRDMAERFARGGRLLVFGAGPAAIDAQHVAVEFVHPVIVGKRALPALAVTGDAGSAGLAARVGLLGAPGDLALGLTRDGGRPAAADQEVYDALQAAGRVGLLTVLLACGPTVAPHVRANHTLVAATTDPLVAKELQVTTYHLLWELVHVFVDRMGTPAP